LLYKIEKRIKSKKKNIKNFLCHLLNFLGEGKIDLVIPQLLKKSFQKISIKDSNYLDKGTYWISKFQKNNLKINNNFQDNSENYFFFDSRVLNPRFLRSNNFRDYFIKFIKENPIIKKRAIIILKVNNSVNNFKDFGVDYYLSNSCFQEWKSKEYNSQKIKITLERQKKFVEVIKKYRNNNMCFYIPLIESIHYQIIKLQNDNRVNFEKIQKFTQLFAYYCIKFVYSEWINIQTPNPYKWETFFKTYKLPIYIRKLDFKSLKFFGETFQTEAIFQFFVCVNSKNIGLIQKLKGFGYKSFKSSSLKDKTVIGGELNIKIPCPSIESFFFIFKYICYYNLFLLFYHCFSYFKQSKKEVKFHEKEKNFCQLFLPVLNPLFNLKEKKIQKNLNFQFKTLNSDVLKVIFGKFLISKVKNIEVPLFRYFLMKTPHVLKNSHNLPTDL
ncbi:MAG: hypothetical protein ACOC1P_01360, partial [Minisyncoccales bacterium]